MFIWTLVNPNWHELWKQEKCSSLAPPRGIFYKIQWACQFLPQFFDKNSADKIWFKKDKEWKVPSLMPIRVNGAMLHNLDREKKLALHYQSTYTVYLPAQMT